MAKISFTCPNEQCQAPYEVEESLLGKKGRCKRCGNTFLLTCWSKGNLLLDDFEIERLLGAGGMGAVYLVRSRSRGNRFAVKTILANRVGDQDSQRNFLSELQTWIDLPEHPHLAACRFFRTAGGQVVIFAEYVEGGSLADWIRDRKLTGLDQVLDVAIQFAWGLHAAHELGLIHQDVKPGNLLMTPEGIAKVSDFGLARARATADEQSGGGAGQSILVSWGGMTRAYCSPEQADGRPLSRKTDIWSWGVSVLEMFTGEVTWKSGRASPDALESYLEMGAGDSLLPAMPAGVVEVLRKCFRLNPAERWPTLAGAADALRGVYRQVVGQDHARQVAAALGRDTRVVVTHDRWTTGGVQWVDPRAWLVKALEAEGREPAEAEALLPPRTGSRKAQAIADLAVYEEARRLFERLVASGRKELESQLAGLRIEKAFVHENVDDIPGAVALYDQAIDLYKRLVQQEGRSELAVELARVYLNKANAVNALGDRHAAVALYDRAIDICERLVHREGHSELANDLAIALENKAIVVSALGDPRAAVALCDQAIDLYERLVHQEGRSELKGDWARIMIIRARNLLDLGERGRARTEACEAKAILQAEVSRTGQADLQNVLEWAARSLKEVL